jgi:nickel-dependent lactate racemase
MKLVIPYGRDEKLAELPSSATYENPSHDQMPATPLPTAEIISIFKNKLMPLLDGSKRVALIVNDVTKRTPTAFILRGLLPLLEELEIDFKVVIGGGAEPYPSITELQRILSPGVYYAILDRIIVHDATRSKTEKYGTTSLDTPVELNSEIMSFDKIICINSVEPHYYQGWTGSVHSLFPGISSYDSIIANTRWALSTECKPMKLIDNPVAEDISEALGFLNLGRFIGIQTVLNKFNKILSMHIGNLKTSYKKAIAEAEPLYKRKINQKPKIVIAVVKYPSDKRLDTAHLAVENVRHIISPGDSVILVAQCRNGIGFKRAVDSLDAGSTLVDYVDQIAFDTYHLGDHVISRFYDLVQNNNLRIISEMPANELEEHGIPYSSTLQEAVKQAIDRHGKKSVITCVNPENYVPELS